MTEAQRQTIKAARILAERKQSRNALILLLGSLQETGQAAMENMPNVPPLGALVLTLQEVKAEIDVLCDGLTN